ncbi:MAG TPA: YfiR family protein [Steroidobacteraceae bacterium]|jgi:hypothetical protein
MLRASSRYRSGLAARILAAFAACLCAVFASAATPEYRVKAAFLFNFTQFVEWPPQTDPTPFVIGILGEDPFSSILDETVRGEAVDGRHIVVQRYRSSEEVRTCDILFIGASESGRLDSILEQLRGRPILTVSDLQDFAPHGGAIQFLTVNNKLKLRINPEAAHTAHLTISSKLLRLADIVGADPAHEVAPVADPGRN